MLTRWKELGIDKDAFYKKTDEISKTKIFKT